MQNCERFGVRIDQELKTIHTIIKRMTLNSWLIKAWTVISILGLLLYFGNQKQVCVAFVPLLIFWLLDAYFQRLARLYRKLHDWLVKRQTVGGQYRAYLDEYDRTAAGTKRVLKPFSITLGRFYGTIAVLLAVCSAAVFFY